MSEMRPFCCHGDSLSGPDGRRRWVLGTLSRHLAKGDHAFKVSIRSCNHVATAAMRGSRSEEHTSELQSLMRISYAVFCLKKKTHIHHLNYNIADVSKFNISTQLQNTVS